MSKKTKIILSLIGLGAVVVPALLLILLTGKAPEEPEVSSESRQLDAQTIKEAVEKVPQKPPEFPSPSPATPSAQPSPSPEVEESPSAQ